ncbi:MogA/MoaB family molybdenum cofactor biosynthesis protein [Halococcus hamelinensis]|uniref:Molybdenum cofactor synthesis domain-containing protein n=1 Tax=Halococcus hamelinensis 100A6 TaxID=1132509 RepID=M0M6P0_9EURY|nr:molybdenum cofactor synthesis domain-containing protein [Halococcus hamelinensis]EMA41477.1 molybdenum cofactor synthesis domain-containing protein [Halococcus hamelinensis 100A6]
MADSDDHDDHHHHDHGDEPDHAHHDFDPVAVALITVSTSRHLDDDPAGDAIVAAIEDDGGSVATRELVDDDYDGVQDRVNSLVNRDDVDVVVTTGGTGVTPDDVTVEAVGPLFDKRLPGFGELFRARSREEVGTRVVATRATAGVIEGVPAFCLPGSENAASLGAEIVTAEAGHLAGLAKRDEDVEDENADDGDTDSDSDSDGN